MDAELRKLGQDALTKMNQDIPQAKAYLVQRLLTEKALFRRHIEPIIDATVDEVINRLVLERRYVLRQRLSHRGQGQPIPSAPDDYATRESPPSPLLRLGQERLAKHNWLHYPLMNGRKVLGEMTRPELHSVSHWYLTAGQTNLTTGRWLEAIAKALPDDATRVKEELSEETLQQMRGVAEAAA